jgi:hypothetical protein
VIGFEELWDVRPEREPQIDLGPADSTLEQVLACIRRENPKYRIELLQSGLVHVSPARGTADPAGLLDLRLREFFLPPDDCVDQQLLNMDHCAAFSYPVFGLRVCRATAPNLRPEWERELLEHLDNRDSAESGVNIRIWAETVARVVTNIVGIIRELYGCQDLKSVSIKNLGDAIKATGHEQMLR